MIRILNLPATGWHRFISRRKALFAKAIHELQAATTINGCSMDVSIQQGLNQRDFMLVGKLLPREISQQMPINV
ncbi:MAG TPA: hypothetical protein DEQ47_14115 [Solibacterales bacterium]|nr:hypothetical protein [Bryobacterales bacterium]